MGQGLAGSWESAYEVIPSRGLKACLRTSVGAIAKIPKVVSVSVKVNSLANSLRYFVSRISMITERI